MRPEKWRRSRAFTKAGRGLGRRHHGIRVVHDFDISESNNHVTRRRRLVWVRRTGVFLAGLVVVGYASSFTSRGHVERFVGREIEADYLGTTNVFVLPERSEDRHSYPGSAVVLRRVGFTVRACIESPDGFDCFPWAGISPAEVVGPFLVDVAWGASAGGLSGGGSRTRFFTLFGWVVPIAHLGGWAS